MRLFRRRQREEPAPEPAPEPEVEPVAEAEPVAEPEPAPEPEPEREPEPDDALERGRLSSRRPPKRGSVETRGLGPGED
jgi:hypothetical protein